MIKLSTNQQRYFNKSVVLKLFIFHQYQQQCLNVLTTLVRIQEVSSTMSSAQLRQKNERPAKTRRDAERRARLLAKKREEAAKNMIEIEATVNTKEFYARKQESSKTLGSKTPGMKTLESDYFRLVFKNDEQHCVLRTKAEISDEAVALIQAGDDDNICASALGGSIVFDDNHLPSAQIGANLPEESPKRARVESHMLAHVFPTSTMSKAMIDTLEKSTFLLDLVWPSPTSTKEGNPVRHIACCFNVPRITKAWINMDSVSPFWKSVDEALPGELVPGRLEVPNGDDADIEYFLRTNDSLWKLINSLVKNYYPAAYDVLERLEIPPDYVRVAGVFCGLALNTDTQTLSHRESSDWPYGVCVVISYGNATGGQLALQEQVDVQLDEGRKTFKGVILPGFTGSITIFRPALVRHFNVPCTGKRNSIMLFTDDRLMSYGKNSQFCKLRLE